MSAYARSRGNLLARAIRWFGPRSLLILVLLVVALLSVTTGLSQAVPEMDNVFIAGVLLTAVAIGWVMGLLPMRIRLAFPLSLLFGAEFLLIRVGRLGMQLAAVAQAILQFLWELFLWYYTEVPPVWEPIRIAYLDLWSDMGTLLTRTGVWLNEVATGGSSYDAVGSAVIWGAIVWLFSWWAGWQVRRNERPLSALLPGSLLLAFVLSYTNTNPYIFLPVVGLTLVLLAAVSQRARETRWESKGVDFSQGLWTDVLSTATGIAIAVVILAAIAPSISFDRISQWVEEMTSDTVEERTESVADSLGLEQKPEPAPARPLESARITSLPQRHLIGSGPELSRKVVMVIETGELSRVPQEMPPDEQTVPRHYWRSLTYDYYFGRGWSTSSTELVSYEAGASDIEEEVELEADHLKRVRQSVRVLGEKIAGVVHVDGQLLSVDEPFDVQWRPPGDAFAATTEAREYRADSVAVDLTVEQLREASTVYPDWISQRYLQLHERVPQRVLSLARDLTATEPTPYDRAVAIERYLRQFEYTLDVNMPPTDREIADYFIFDLQKGYCDYYATSMVVLARAAGLPARLVIGYVSGTYDPYNARYVVTEADAHAWPEIYFPGYGWVEFEPTGGRAPIMRDSEEDQLEEFDFPDLEPLVPEARRDPWEGLIIGQWALMVVGGFLAIIGVTTGVDSAALRLQSPRKATARLFRRLRRSAHRLRVPTHEGDTPHELASALNERVGVIAEAHGFTGVEFLEPAVDEIEDLTTFYADTWYGPEGGVSSEDRGAAVWTWWRLRWRLMLAVLWRRSGMPKPPPEEDETEAEAENQGEPEDEASVDGG